MKKATRDTINKSIREKVRELDGLILDRLYGEWSMVQTKKSSINVISVHPSKLLAWYKELKITRDQLEAVMRRLFDAGLISDFEYVEGDQDEYDDFNDWLRITFVQDFEGKFWAQDTKLKREVSDSRLWAKAAATNNTLHLYVKEPKSKGKTHVIFDSDGQIRFDKSDRAPGEIFSEIDATLTTREGKQIRARFRFE